MVEFLFLPIERRQLYIEQVSAETGMSKKAVEKDWWVTLVLKTLFTLPMAQHFVFKGGTSLSKGWRLIQRLSEDIDIALASDVFGKKYISNPSHRYVKQLKREGTIYSSSVIANAMYHQLLQMGVPEELFSVSVELIKPDLPDKDPQAVYVHYNSFYGANPYLADHVKVEFGVRSLLEPFDNVAILSEIGSHIKVPSYSEQPFLVRAVLPEKTMIEKLLLLHEKFSPKGEEDIAIAERQSRHLIDIVRLKHQDIHHRIFSNPALFRTIIEHRNQYVRQKGVTYNAIALDTLQFIPPAGTREQFRQDYAIMQREMIYGEAPEFEVIMSEMIELAEFFKKLSP